MKKSITLGLSLATVSLLIVGCGGGDSASLFEDAKVAPASVESGTEVAKNIAANQGSSGLGSLSTDNDTQYVIESGSNTALLANSLMNLANSTTTKYQSEAYALNQAFEGDQPCQDGGSVHIKGSLTSSKYSVTGTYNECRIGSTYYNGSMAIKMSRSGDSISSMSLSFPNDFFSNDGVDSTKVFKSSSITMNNFANDSFDMTTTLKMDVNGALHGSENSKWRVSDSTIYQLSGKEYINDLGNCVTYDESYDMSETPFRYSSYGNLISGEARYIADDNGKIVLEVTGTNELTVKVDADNDGVYETEEIVSDI